MFRLIVLLYSLVAFSTGVLGQNSTEASSSPTSSLAFTDDVQPSVTDPLRPEITASVSDVLNSLLPEATSGDSDTPQQSPTDPLLPEVSATSTPPPAVNSRPTLDFPAPEAEPGLSPAVVASQPNAGAPAATGQPRQAVPVSGSATSGSSSSSSAIIVSRSISRSSFAPANPTSSNPGNSARTELSNAPLLGALLTVAAGLVVLVLLSSS